MNQNFLGLLLQVRYSPPEKLRQCLGFELVLTSLNRRSENDVARRATP